MELSLALGDPEVQVLQRHLVFTIDLSTVFLSNLKQLMELSSWTTWIVKDSDLKILTTTPDRSSYASFDMASHPTFVNWTSPDGYALRVDLNSWFPLLSNLMTEQPVTVVFIRKRSGSVNLFCWIMGTEEEIELGDAQFVPVEGMNINSLNCKVKFNTSTLAFRDAVEAFAAPDEPVRLVMNNIFTIRWVGASGEVISHQAQISDTCSSVIEDQLQLQLKWSWPFFQFMTAAIKRTDKVEVSILTDAARVCWYHFRFLNRSHRNAFCYMEKGPSDN